MGTVSLTSSDPRGVFPTTIVFTAADEGVKSIDGISLRPPGPQTITATAPDGTVGSVSIAVINLGPSGLTVSTDHQAINEGDTLTLSGAFTNPDPQDTHTVTVVWGDGSHTTQPLGAGVFQFQVTHQFTHSPAAPATAFPIAVTVTDAAGGTTTGEADVAVANVPPTLPPSGGIATGDAGGPFGQTIPFTDPGTDAWTATADYGDGTGPHPVPIAGHTLTLDHVYTGEGTFTIKITLQDGAGGTATLTEQAVVFLPGTTGVKLIVIPAGQSGTITIPGAVVTLQNLGGTTPAVLAVGLVRPKVLAGLKGSPSADPTQLVSAYDIRQLNAGPDSILTAQLTYPKGRSGRRPDDALLRPDRRRLLPGQGQHQGQRLVCRRQAGPDRHVHTRHHVDADGGGSGGNGIHVVDPGPDGDAHVNVDFGQPADGGYGHVAVSVDVRRAG